MATRRTHQVKLLYSLGVFSLGITDTHVVANKPNAVLELKKGHEQFISYFDNHMSETVIINFIKMMLRCREVVRDICQTTLVQVFFFKNSTF